MGSQKAEAVCLTWQTWKTGWQTRDGVDKEFTEYFLNGRNQSMLKSCNTKKKKKTTKYVENQKSQAL